MIAVLPTNYERLLETFHHVEAVATIFGKFSQYFQAAVVLALSLGHFCSVSGYFDLTF